MLTKTPPPAKALLCVILHLTKITTGRQKAIPPPLISAVLKLMVVSVTSK